jgi:hypothetical protein
MNSLCFANEHFYQGFQILSERPLLIQEAGTIIALKYAYG